MDGEPLLLDSLDHKGSSRGSSRKQSREEENGTCETSFSINLPTLGEWTPLTSPDLLLT